MRREFFITARAEQDTENVRDGNNEGLGWPVTETQLPDEPGGACVLATYLLAPLVMQLADQANVTYEQMLRVTGEYLDQVADHFQHTNLRDERLDGGGWRG